MLIHRIHCLNKKEQMIISVNVERAHNKIQDSFMIKPFRNLSLEENIINLVKEYLQNPITTIILNDERLNPLSLRSRIGQECSLSPLLFILLEVPANAMHQEKEMKGIRLRKKRKLSLFVDDMIAT